MKEGEAPFLPAMLARFARPRRPDTPWLRPRRRTELLALGLVLLMAALLG